MALRLLVLDCAEDEESGQNETDEEAYEAEFAACCNGEDGAEYGECDNDCAPNDAGLCLFGLVAVLNTNDTGDKLYNRTYESEESRYDEQTECAARKSIGSDRCDEGYDTEDDSEGTADYHDDTRYLKKLCTFCLLFHFQFLLKIVFYFQYSASAIISHWRLLTVVSAAIFCGSVGGDRRL